MYLCDKHEELPSRIEKKLLFICIYARTFRITFSCREETSVLPIKSNQPLRITFSYREEIEIPISRQQIDLELPSHIEKK